MIVCLGTTPTVQRTMVFPKLTIDTVNRAANVVESASGKSINVARVLHTLREKCVATGFLGGQTGELIRTDLDQAGIAHDFVDVAAKTRTCTTLIDQSTGQVTELVEESKQVETDAWERIRARILSLLDRAKMLILSGSLTPNAPHDFYAWCVARAHERSVATIVDASGLPLRESLALRPLLVKPNRMELARTLDTPTESDSDLRHAVKQLSAEGPEWVAITLGREGSIISNGKDFWRVRAPEIKAVSPIGSGDAYAAGVAAALMRGEKLPEAARLGAACAAANAMIPVAGHLRLQDVSDLLPRIALEAWDA